MKYQKIIALYIILLCNCTKTINVKTQIIDKIQHVKPQICKYQDIKPINFKTKIVDNNLLIDNNNLAIFLQNFQNFKLNNKKYIKCIENNNSYYETILKSYEK